jgi:hypothetical protein
MRRSLLALLLVSGCVGTVSGEDPGTEGTPDPVTGRAAPSPGGSPTAPGASNPGSAPTGPAGTALPPPTSVGATPLRRMTRVEYANTVRDLLGATSNVAAAFSSDTLGVAGYTVGGAVTPVEANQYQEAAEQLAADAVKNLKAILPCAGTTPLDEAACSDRFVTAFGKRAYRRPVSSDEATDLKALYASLRKDGYDFGNAIRIVLEAMLESPNFLYRPELGAAGGTATMKPLSTFEVASRLSYFVWQSMPDDALLTDAESGALARADVLDKHVRRMLADDRARAALAQFGTGWLRLDYGDVVKDAKVYPLFTPQVKTSMLKEAGEFVSQTLLGGGAADALFTADYTFGDSALAKIYGVTAPTAAGMQRLTLDPAQGRSGLLTQVAFLTKFAGPSATSPTRRGVMVREQFLCQDIPPPPPDLNPTPPAASPTLSVRDQVTQHMKDPSCAGCHRLIDPVGLSLESFDGVGKYRTSDGGKPIDATGELTGTDADGTVAGARDLGQRLGRSAGAKRCLATQMFRFALGRMEDRDGAALDRILAAFAAGKYDARELMAALAKSEAFLYRPGT